MSPKALCTHIICKLREKARLQCMLLVKCKRTLYQVATCEAPAEGGHANAQRQRGTHYRRWLAVRSRRQAHVGDWLVRCAMLVFFLFWIGCCFFFKFLFVVRSHCEMRVVGHEQKRRHEIDLWLVTGWRLGGLYNRLWGDGF